MINQAVLGALLGSVLAVFYFGGLWFTVQKIPGATRPQLLLIFSFLLRASVAIACFFLALQKGTFMFYSTVLFFFAFRFLLTTIFGKIKGGVYANQS